MALITKSLDLVRQISQEIRTTSYRLHPPMPGETGFGRRPDGTSKGWSNEAASISHWRFRRTQRHSREIGLVIFRVVPEALTNVYRHCGSKTAEIQTDRGQDSFDRSRRRARNPARKARGNSHQTLRRRIPRNARTHPPTDSLRQDGHEDRRHLTRKDRNMSRRSVTYSWRFQFCE